MPHLGSLIEPLVGQVHNVLPQTVLRVVYNGGQGVAQTVLGVAHRGGGSLWHLGLLDSRSDGEQTKELSSSRGKEENEEEEGVERCHRVRVGATLVHRGQDYD